jgi:hypothetical protein
MLIEAHQRSAGDFSGSIGRFSAASSLCVLSIALTLALCAQASASGPATTTLAAATQSTTQQLSSTAGPPVERVAAAAHPTASPAPSAAPAAAAPRLAAPTANVASPQASGSHGAGVPAVVRDTGERIVAASVAPGGEGHAAIQSIAHTATPGGGPLRAAPVTGVVRALTPGRAGEATRSVMRAVADAAGSTHVAQTLTSTASSLTATVGHTTRLGGAVGQLTGSVSRPVVTALETIAHGGVAHPPAAQQHARTATSPSWVPSRAHAAVLALAMAPPTLASPQPPASVAGSLPATSIAPGLGALPGWGAWAPAASAGDPMASGPVASWPATWLAQDGRSATSSQANGAHPAPLPASPPPMPSPGGVSPAAVVGPAAGLSIVLALAALLMLAAPLAARRLRLDGESWRLAPFVLIADRPG